MLRKHDVIAGEEEIALEPGQLFIMEDKDLSGSGILRENIQLEKGENYLRCFFDNFPEGVVMVDENCVISRVNQKFCEMFGYSREELEGKDLDQMITRSPGLKEQACEVTLKARSGRGSILETVRRRKDGSLFPVSILAMPLAKGMEGASAYAVYRDLSQIRNAERNLELRIGFESLIANISSTFMTSEDVDLSISKSLKEICYFFRSSYVSVFLFNMDDSSMYCSHEYSAEENGEDLSPSREYDLSDLPWFYQKIITEKQFIVEDVSLIPKEGFREKSIFQANNIVSMINIPFFMEERPVGFVSVRNLRDVFLWKQRDIEDLRLYCNLLGAVLLRKKIEEELEIRNMQLLSNVEDMIKVLGKIIEVGDPYTGGHQQRVSQLAVAIAEEMNFSEEKIIPIRYAALVHDVGKIKIPSSILIKPGKITGTEMDMIRTHSYYGKEILKTVEFPWPISEMIYQHHERLDGSGYPRGLKASEIMVEAKILAVADVVEAMLSHRPYRSSLGMERTISELKNNRGILYEEEVVDACLILLEKKGFTFREIRDFLP